jgi:hypothetical protein
MRGNDMNLIEHVDHKYLNINVSDPRYANSVFRSLKELPPKQKGKFFELIVSDVLTKIGFSVKPPVNTDHDRIVNSVKVEIKGSTLAKGCPNFSFLQIRTNQDYDKLLFAMFYPDELVLMEMSKEDVAKNIESGVFKKQHGGNKGESGTYCYYGNKETLLLIGGEIID